MHNSSLLLVLLAFLVFAWAPCAANADESSDKQSDSDNSFRLKIEKKDQNESEKPKKIQFKSFARGLMYPISPHTRENKHAGISATEAKTLKGAADAQALADFDLELVVDESESMKHRDCPGNISRWQWCGEELSDLSQLLSPHLQHGFTLTTFASDYQVLKNARPEDVTARFEKHPSDVSTRLSAPLNSRFKNFFETRSSSSKPALVVVITDGVPHPPQEAALVVDSIISASKRVQNNNELTVVFFLVGRENQEGQQFVKELDDDLVNRGAKYDIVRSMPFEELEHVGLVNALVSLVREFAKAPAPAPAPAPEKSDRPKI
jgi:hypothetical protein